MGGGGANSLDSPLTGGNNDLNDPKGQDLTDKEAEQTWTEPTYKSYSEYLIELFNMPSEVYTIADGVVTIKYSSITRDKKNDEIELSFNGIIFDKITKEDLVGNGSSSQPYVVHSTKGFLYIMNVSFSNTSLNDKYLELGKNIVFNDETFDKEGNPKGGDGIVYSWTPSTSGSGLVFDGNGYSISGLYFNDITKVGVSLFAQAPILKEVSNLIVKDFYFKGKYIVAGICCRAEVVKSCVAKAGTLLAGQNVAGIVGSIHGKGIIENCINESSIYITLDIEGCAQQSAAGMCFEVSTQKLTIKNCINYGHIEASYGYIAGITAAGNYNATMLIENCVNYGKLVGRSYNGGIVSSSLRGNKQIINCINYGTQIGEISVGGILGYASSQVSILNCKSKGKIVSGGQAVAGIVGQVYLYTGIGAGNLTVEGCEIFIDQSVSSCRYALFGIFTHEGSRFMAKNCKITIENYNQAALYSSCSGEHFVLKNIQIDLRANTTERRGFVLNENIILSDFSKVEMENIHIRSNFDTYRNYLVSYCKNADVEKLHFDGIVFESTQGQKLFYGEDFSQFYISWKTGKIALNNKKVNGLFESKLSRQLLVDNGFVEFKLFS